jgi:hypothetical protein
MENIRRTAQRSDEYGRKARDVLEAIAGIQRMDALER